MSFVHLHTHSHYSLLDGLSKIPEIVHAAKKQKMDAVALTDHGNMYGAIEFYETCIEEGVKPIIGLEAYVSPGPISVKEPRERPYHLILLAKNRLGYQNLIKLMTIANLEGFYYKPRIDFELLKEYKEGLIILSGCLSGPIPRAISAGDMDKAREIAAQYLEVFGPEHFYLEVQHNPSIPEQTVVNNGLVQLHNELGIELVATADSHYIHPEDNEAQDVLLSIGTKSLLSDPDRFSMRHEDLSFAPAEKMIELFEGYERAVENTVKIAEMVQIDLTLGEIQLPHYGVPEGMTAESYLKELCEEGAAKKYPEITQEIRERMDYELSVIAKTGYAPYFLIVQDFINWAKNEGIAVGPGRGSAAGSIVAFLTGITDIDPIRYTLLFERFLNPERVSMPDIDTDFADARRNDVLRYVEQRYGKDRVAQIITFGTIGARAGIRDVGRVLGLSYGYCDQIAKLIPQFTTLGDAIDSVPELKQMMQDDNDAARLLSIAQKLEGVARHTSVHACAVVITKDPLTDMVPLQLDSHDGGDGTGTIITQYSMNPIEHLGLLKMDFLGLKNLTIIEDTINIVRATRGIEVSMETIPLDDPATFKLLQQADTVGVFQLESSGMRRYLKQLQPTEIEDIIVMVSLYRPGPMDFIPQYIDGKHGKREVTFIHDSLRPILEPTYGIAVYQEQIMEIARSLAGFSYGEADVLRKAVGKKIKSLLDEQEYKMIDGMVKNGIESKIAKQIWEFILPFARYGFNRSHAACYAMIAYRTAYLKANYPAQFMAALLNADRDDTDRIAIEVQQAQQMGIRVLPPDINESFGAFSVVKETVQPEFNGEPAIRFGLHAIKNVGDHIVKRLIAERKEGGPYTSIEDLLSRVKDKDLNKKSLDSLIKAGALKRFLPAHTLLFNLETLLQFAKNAQQEANNGQINLFASLPSSEQPKLTLQDAPAIDEHVLLQWEKDLMGLYISGHPMERYRELLEQQSIPFRSLRELQSEETVSLIGNINYIKRIITKRGSSMAFIGFGDHTDDIELLIFPKLYNGILPMIHEGMMAKAVGKVDTKDGTVKVIIDTLEAFDPEPFVVKGTIFVTLPEKIQKSLFRKFQKIVEAAPGQFAVTILSGGKQMSTKQRVSLDCVSELQELLGQSAIRVVE